MSSIAVALGFAQPADAAPQPPKRLAKGKATAAGTAGARAVAGAVPAEVTVADGDTVSGIAERYGLSTAELLAANGLGWSSLIFPGQRLVLPGGTPRASEPAPEIARHTVVAGDTMGGIAERYGVDLAQLLSANGLGRESLIFPGQQVVLPLAGAASAPSAPAEQSPPATAEPPAQVTVAEGDTAWDLAERLDVDLDAFLAANRLSADPVLQPGQVLTVPRPAAVALVASVSTVLTDEMRQNAQLVVDIGRALGVPDRGIVIALAAAAQESGLRNVRHGDRDSLGLFQQRPSQGWGTPEQVLDPVRATTAFYGGAANPNPGVTRGLLDIPGWESMSVTDAAQAVQLSAYPSYYAKWEAQATAWLSELG
ncbi:LysM peptidoglycan-binding domain-containing protein [Agromyces soli]|uniref:LysM peptidoglycan-binding domain-containing protein n=1 Tax=Agromyces soli TaxID=659012 RepID=A0ABY4AS30_9MICO|nr:LysM peptidoglycan-binding domain-containing protein [Agromyces soli]UOE25669.1 LysM peptidoglycan-binding domain-containing protein [Agromyces soli]